MTVAALVACAVSVTPIPVPTRVHIATKTAPPLRATVIPIRTPTVAPTNTASVLLSTPVPVTLAPVATNVSQPIAAAPKNNIMAYEASVRLDAYPYEPFLRDERDPATNIIFKAFDRAAYENAAAASGRHPKTFRAIVLENEYLKVTLIPALGGRIFQITYKPTGQNLLYNNQVLKPTPWGMPQQDGWLAAGGIEWAFPTQEHGFEWNAAWDAQILREANGVSVVLADSQANDRPRVQVRVTLPAHAAYLAISPRIENPTAQPLRLQFWTNALLNLGATGRIPAQTEFIFPTDAVFVHSTANEWIPGDVIPKDNARMPSAAVSFSNLAGRDLRWYANWDNYLGVFAANPHAPELAQAFVGAYNYENRLGIARIFSPQQTPGVKLFAWGPNFCCRDRFTDDDSEYLELWGGMTRTFFPDDDVTLQPGEMRAWTEYILPLPDTNGVSAATSDFAMTVQTQPDRVILTAYAAARRDAVLVLKHDAREIKRWSISFQPAQHFQEQIAITERPLQLQLQDRDGNVILEVRN
ncbi:MAG: DUF5107 domain-containing protein [Chloroflexi bacterium]|nr:DUF5107 domain-containing protein [Chloroflexota bacterium]